MSTVNKNIFALLALIVIISGCADVKFDSARVEGQKTCSGSGCDPIIPKAPIYTWTTSDYGSCSKPCDGGEQSRSVICKRDDGVNVADELCKDPKPASVQTCNLNACTASHAWNIGPFGLCSKTCGGGTQTRSVVCQTNAGQSASENLCPQPKPTTQQSCNTQACDPNYTFSWDVGTYGTCSKTCGGGTQTRPVVCKRSDGITVEDLYCVAIPKPATQQACNTQSCDAGYTYSWLLNPYSTCSKTCGGGTQTRSVVCQRNDGQFVSEALCPLPKPVTQQTCNTQTCPINTRPVTTTHTVTTAESKVDILLIFDDSASMAVDNNKLASRMSTFLSDLSASNLDYQICVTATNVDFYQGRPIIWVGTGTHIMKPSTPNKQTVLNDTITAIGSGYSSDEQAIKAANLAIADNARTGCFRSKAALSIILISDEDERSVGGIQALSPIQYQPLGPLNYPDSLIQSVANTFNTASFKKPFTVNSIIVKPGDTTCEAQQDAQGVPSFPGRLYSELSNKTEGYVGSICASDYTTNLKYVKERIQNSLPAVQLECTPIGTPVVTITPSFATTKTLVGNEMRFDPAIPEGRTIQINYNCPL